MGLNGRLLSVLSLAMIADASPGFGWAFEVKSHRSVLSLQLRGMRNV